MSLSQSGGKQTILSSYFNPQPSSSPEQRQKNKKRPNSDIIDLTSDISDGPDEIAPTKRPKTILAQNTCPKHSSASVPDQWRYDSSPSATTPSTDASSSRAARHEAFKKKLLLENKKASLFRSPSHQEVVESDDTPSKPFSKTNIGRNTKKPEEVGPSGEPYTPLEKQVLQLQKDNVGTLLMVEVGYKYRFFGNDAKIASRELGIVCFPDRNFIVASIPTHRWEIHLKKLLSKGHRVGIVSQVETAALKKVSDNRNAPFKRKLFRLYTAATFVDDLSSADEIERYAPPPILCIIEDSKGANDSQVTIGLIAISPSTGDVIWDEFDDVLMRLGLETRLEHLKPTEILVLRDGLTHPTQKVLTHLPGNVRLEYYDEQMLYTDAFSLVSTFYSAAGEPERIGRLLAAVSGFPRRVVIALAQIIDYLKAFDIADTLMEANFFERFTAHSRTMILGANTLHNLEIFNNETDGTIHGSLLSILDHTKTKFGARLLKRWVGQPLTNKAALQERTNAVEEILSSSSEKLLTLRQSLSNLPDLAKGLSRIHYGQCTPKEISVLLPAFNKIAIAFEPFSDPSHCGFTSTVLNDIVFALPQLREPVQGLLDAISIPSAAEGRKETLWKDPEKYPHLEDCHDLLRIAEAELMDELKSIRKLLKLPSLEWTSVAGEEYLVEIKNTDKRPIPPAWPLISKTKYNTRYRPPEVKKKMEERSQYQEILETECNRAFRSFLSEITKHYGLLRNAINKLAVADCLFSLAQVALKPDYVRPTFTDVDQLEIVDGRHPMVEVIRLDPFIPNTIRMGSDENPQSKIITGPNMGGKSSLVRMVALIAIMAQIGSYVPAASAKLSMLDAILTRMGAYDDLIRGRSTFMVEMSETSDILGKATSKSLVILDELGRGTSTFDGMAVASATLQHLLQTTGCKTLFITHYPMLAVELSKKFPRLVENMHMGYTTQPSVDGSRNITFLYVLSPGVATESFGVECGRLAKLPEDILRAASEQAATMERETEGRISVERVSLTVKRIRRCLRGKDDKAVRAELLALLDLIDELRDSGRDSDYFMSTHV